MRRDISKISILRLEISLPNKSEFGLNLIKLCLIPYLKTLVVSTIIATGPAYDSFPYGGKVNKIKQFDSGVTLKLTLI